ncbi:MAG: hypothetical protein II979_00585, partial [Clostridia bacterium]|nr:hypothetical protein [Clostridia bacterium]
HPADKSHAIGGFLSGKHTIFFAKPSVLLCFLVEYQTSRRRATQVWVKASRPTIFSFLKKQVNHH